MSRLFAISALVEPGLSILEEPWLVALADAARIVDTNAGVNAAVVHRMGERFAVGAWVGKSWGSKIEGGGAIRASW